MGEHPSWDAKRETDEQKAERIVAEELRKRRWAEGTLKERRKTDDEKVKLAQRRRHCFFVRAFAIALLKRRVASIEPLKLIRWKVFGSITTLMYS